MRFAKHLAAFALILSIMLPSLTLAASRGGGVPSSWLGTAKRGGLTAFAPFFGYDRDGAPPDLRFIIARIIQVILGFLGTIFIVLIIYAGFTWMTASGNEEKISKAKQIMGSSAIGLAIVLSAFLITIFVTRSLMAATNKEFDPFYYGN